MAGEAIFIGYRREDTADVAGRLHEHLARRFGKSRIFMDVDNLRPGADFGEYIKTVLPKCRLALILIGPGWLNARDERGSGIPGIPGRRRLDDANDWVRLEIETALATPGLDVVPVLVNGARMPQAEELPPSLQPLLRRHAAIIRRNPDFQDDVARLIAALRASVKTGVLDFSGLGGESKAAAAGQARAASRTLLLIGSMIAAALVLAVGGFGVSRWLPQIAQNEEDRAETTAREQQARVEEPERTQQQASPPSAAWPFHDCPDVCPDMASIPGQAFAAGRYEVTFAQWDACVAAGGCNGYNPSDEGWGRGNRPVINVSWNDAQAYVQWLSRASGQRYRLLTSNEWEIAARAGTPTNYSWGDQDPVCELSARNGANFSGCNNRTLPVGSFQPNAFGLYDAHGNVWEWVEDCNDSGCSSRVLRGGSWQFSPVVLRSANRSGGNLPTIRYYDIGFRVGRTL